MNVKKKKKWIQRNNKKEIEWECEFIGWELDTSFKANHDTFFLLLVTFICETEIHTTIAPAIYSLFRKTRPTMINGT